jgi:BirA family biotin operon repressor/biotin-[acetyl-CoA-carboxylase] ligase
MNSDFEWTIEVLAETPSTQDLVKERAEQGSLEGFGIQALSQSAGYGRHRRDWIGLEDNLFLSFILRPACSAEDAGQMALVVGEALAESIRASVFKPDLVSLKWPNDVLLDGQKCAGILIESSLKSGRVDWLVVGVGVNIAAAPEGPFTALAAFCEEVPNLEVFKDRFLSEMRNAYSRWQKDGFGAIRAHW